MFKEIPFIDAPEGAFVWTASHREGLMNNREWLDKRPYLLCVDDKGWEEIKKGWLQACVMAGPRCNEMVHTVDELVRKLDNLAGSVIKLP